jgi:hypothetical protein
MQFRFIQDARPKHWVAAMGPRDEAEIVLSESTCFVPSLPNIGGDDELTDGGCQTPHGANAGTQRTGPDLISEPPRTPGGTKMRRAEVGPRPPHGDGCRNVCALAAQRQPSPE